MAKIPFTLEAWLKDKSQKVETRDGRTARIICTDTKADDGACIIALIPGYGGEEAYQFFPNGHAYSSKSSDEDCADLFIITRKPELTEKKIERGHSADASKMVEQPKVDLEKALNGLEEEAEEWAENEAYGKSDAEFEMAYKGFIAGAKLQKQQMLKEAVEGGGKYIRKDALLKWLENKVELSYGVAADALVEVIEKINEM